ncbi:MAG TPA: 2-isopropylmalate synthase, partial [Terriglobales bacterium]|nr:2-isopropylmalate synthase [Terriglobales bacterium]
MRHQRVTIFDTTLRDGEPSPGCSMNLHEKLRMARQLDRLGVDVIEAGFPIASDGDFEAVQAIAAEIGRPQIAALARAAEQDIDRAWQAVSKAKQPRLHVFLATSDIHLHFKLRMTREQALERAITAIRYASSLCANVEFSPEDATRTDLAFLCDVVEAVAKAGASVINIPDTVGYILPQEMSRIVGAVCERVQSKPGVTISVHCHNDLGLAVANSLAAIEAGARQVECTINGIGERAGNASLEELVMALRVRSNALPCDSAVRTDQLFAASQLLTEITSVPVQPNKAIVGRNAFAHEAGIHQDGVLKNPLTYEIMTPQSVGVPDNKLVLGKHSGRHALAKKCNEFGYELERRDLDRVYRRFVALADQVKAVSDQQLLALVRD